MLHHTQQNPNLFLQRVRIFSYLGMSWVLTHSKSARMVLSVPIFSSASVFRRFSPCAPWGAMEISAEHKNFLSHLTGIRLGKNVLTSRQTGKQTPPPRPCRPLPVFALENNIFRRSNRPAPAVYAAGYDCKLKRALQGFFDGLIFHSFGGYYFLSGSVSHGKTQFQVSREAPILFHLNDRRRRQNTPQYIGAMEDIESQWRRKGGD